MVLADNAGVVNEAPVNKELPPLEALYQLNVGEEAADEAVSAVLLPLHIMVAPDTPLTLGIGFTVTGVITEVLLQPLLFVTVTV